MSTFARTVTVPGLTLFQPPNTVDRITWGLTSLAGWDEAPEIRSGITEATGADGGHDGPGLYSSRVITVAGWMRAPDGVRMQGALELLAAVTQDPGMLTVDGPGEERSAWVRPTGRNIIEASGPAGRRFQLQYTAPDHRKYGPLQPYSTFLPGDPGPGADFGSAGGLDFGTTGAVLGNSNIPGGVRLLNTGTTRTEPVITLNGGSDGLTAPVDVVEQVRGRLLRYDGDIAPGSRVVLDLRAFSVLLNDAVNRRELLTVAQWWSLPRGVPTPVSWTHGGGTSDAYMTIDVRPAHL